MTILSFTVGPFAENTYVVHDAGEAALIDPGTWSDAERQAVVDYVEAAGLAVRHLLLTHAHIDHVLGCRYFAGLWAAGAAHAGWQLHAADWPLLANAIVQAELFGIRVDEPPAATHALEDGDEITLGGTALQVLHTPGHSPGSVCLYDEAGRAVIGGDVLFAGSVGRTDLWEGSEATLLASIRDRLLVLPDDTVVYPGHGPATTIGRERATNPFLVGGGPL
jgi:glyoxylase-like metal-dependent hydrolase (beta-lactamase superfamily II)